MSSKVNSAWAICWPSSSRNTCTTRPPSPMASIEPVTRATLFSSMPVGAIDAGHLDVAVGEVAPQAGAHAHAMHDHAQLAGDVQRAAGRVVDAVGQQDHRGDLAGRKLLRRRPPSARNSEVALPVGVSAGSSCGPSQQLRLLGKRDRQQAKIVLQLLAPFFQLAAGLVEAALRPRRRRQCSSTRRYRAGRSAPASPSARSDS